MPYDKELPARLRALIPSAEGQRLFRNVVNSQLRAGKSESVAFASAWAALDGAGYKKTDGKWVKKLAIAEVAKRQVQDDMFTMPDEARARSVDLGLEGRIHVASDDLQGYYMPGADHDEYVAALERVGLITSAEAPDDSPTPDGLVERVVAALVREAVALEINKRFDVLKTDDEQRIVWGWASVSTVNGELLTDTQGDVIEPAEMVKMANAYMNTARAGKVMHFGEPVAKMLHSFPLTKELGEMLGVSSDREGWIVGMKVEDDTIWKMVKQGTFTGFSIGGRAKKREARQ